MARLSNRTFAVIGILSLTVLTWALFFRSPAHVPVNRMDRIEGPGEELESFLADKMDYGLQFSRILVEKRIARARDIARQNGAWEPKVREVVDSLQARLSRRAVVGGE